MDTFTTYRIETWKEFKTSFIEELRTIQVTAWPDAKKEWSKRRFLFRGQGCSGWPLSSSFDRWISKQGKSRGESDKIEQYYRELLANYTVNGLEMDLLPDEFASLPKRADEFEKFEDDSAQNRLSLMKLQAYAQHRGLATRLLDWSHSPYVAAFFAFSQWRRCRSKCASIWCLDVDETGRLFQGKEVRHTPMAGADDKRQVWQRGAFTQNNSNLYNMEDLFRDANKRARAESRFPALIRFDIPVDEHKHALFDLELMRINYLSVYPDQEGLWRQSEFNLESRHEFRQER